MLQAFSHRYGYNFQWMGIPIIKYPADILAIQEIIFQTRPEIVIETGVAFGGSLLFLASMLKLMPGSGVVVGVEKNLLQSTRRSLQQSPLSSVIHLVEGDSTDAKTIEQVTAIARGRRGLVLLDSDHTAEHVLQELRLYQMYVAPGCYLVAFDTFIDMFPQAVPGKAYGPNNNPMIAVRRFLAETACFENDHAIVRRLQCTEAPGGYLRRVQE